MASRKQVYRGKTLEELQALSLEEFTKLVPSHQRRTLKRLSVKIKRFLEALKKKRSKPVKTHVREMVILPQMIGLEFLVYNGKEWVKVVPAINMLGQRLGDFSITTKLVKHSGPGIGATRGSKAVELK